MTEREKMAQIVADHLCPQGKAHTRLYGDDKTCYSRNNFVECEKVSDCIDELSKRLDEKCDTCPEVERLKEENKLLRLQLFAFVRNSAVLPVGLRLGKTQQEITDKTFETIAESLKILDVEKMAEFMNLATNKENRYDRE